MNTATRKTSTIYPSENMEYSNLSIFSSDNRSIIRHANMQLIKFNKNISPIVKKMKYSPVYLKGSNYGIRADYINLNGVAGVQVKFFFRSEYTQNWLDLTSEPLLMPIFLNSRDDYMVNYYFMISSMLSKMINKYPNEINKNQIKNISYRLSSIVIQNIIDHIYMDDNIEFFEVTSEMVKSKKINMLDHYSCLLSCGLALGETTNTYKIVNTEESLKVVFITLNNLDSYDYLTYETAIISWGFSLPQDIDKFTPETVDSLMKANKHCYENIKAVCDEAISFTFSDLIEELSKSLNQKSNVINSLKYVLN
jgi:hypothetical protein